MDTQEARAFSQRVFAWFETWGRKDLPWHRDPTPYRIWISEIMLQQTRVSVVIPYFQRFLEHFPQIQDLAQAPEDAVLHLWSGLGYYARARHLHEAARRIVAEYGGRFPEDFQRIQALPGIGRSTAGAIASFAFGQPYPILDGNVKRVLARYWAVPGWPGQAAVQKRLWALSEACTPAENTGAFNQGMMDLGATLCQRTRPACDRCPLSTGCRAHGSGTPTAYPQPKPKRILPLRVTRMLVLHNPRGEVLLERRPPVGIWGGLWSLPELSIDGESIETWCQTQLGIDPSRIEILPSRRHSFSHFQLEIRPHRVDLPNVPQGVGEMDTRIWYPIHAQKTLGLAAPIARILEEIQETESGN